jgi:hypothetical protein
MSCAQSELVKTEALAAFAETAEEKKKRWVPMKEIRCLALASGWPLSVSSAVGSA